MVSLEIFIDINVSDRTTALGLTQPLTDFFLLSPRMLQSVRRHSAVVLTVTINGMQEIHPVIHLLFKRNHKRLGMVSGGVAEYQLYRVAKYAG